jgi:hypothetical protein
MNRFQVSLKPKNIPKNFLWSIVFPLFLCLELMLLTGCMPQTASSSIAAWDQVLPTKEYFALIDPFKPALLERKIKARQAQGFFYPGRGNEVLPLITRRFYALYKGFCPVQESSFYIADDNPIYMTITAKDKEVRLLIYDHTNPLRFRYLFVEARVEVSLPVQCNAQPNS